MTNVFKSNSVTSITKRLENSGENIVEISETLKRFKIAMTSSKETISSSSTSVSLSQDIEKIETTISKKSSTKIVIKESSKESLTQKTEGESFEHMQCVHKVSSSACSRSLSEGIDSESMQKQDRYTVFSRENLLPLVYGVVCSVVFWCLQFTIDHL